jgi:site-specific DNA-methyltransferase (adenine-specific)
MELLRDLPDKSVDWAIVDPPYGSPDTAGKPVIHFTKHRTELGTKRYSAACKYATEKHIEWDKRPDKKYFKELFRVSKFQIVWGGNYFHLPTSRNFIVWDKKVDPRMSFAQAEYAWVSKDGTASVYRQSPIDKNRFHPTQKPVALYIWLLDKFTKEGDFILDTHFGSGSLAVACGKTGREFIGSEIDTDYYTQAISRIERELDGELFYAKG